MTRTKTRPDGGNNAGLAQLLAVCRRLRFEPHDIAGQLDPRGRYEVGLDREFPFLIKLFHYTSRQHTREPTWHERLELFLSLDGPARFRMGSVDVELSPGDLLLVDNFKLHHVVDFPGFDTRAIVISFLPEFVYSLGSPSHDYVFLLPFYAQSERRVHRVQGEDAAASAIHTALAQLLECYFAREDRRSYQAGCKACLLQVLYHLARYFRTSEMMEWQFVRQQERSLRLKKLFDHISRNFADKLTVPEAAAIVHMSEPQFMRNFKRVAGMTLVAYLNHVRLTNALRRLKESDASIAEIASQVGYADQSYFDRRFKASFGQSPTEFRAGLTEPAGTESIRRPVGRLTAPK